MLIFLPKIKVKIKIDENLTASHAQIQQPYPANTGWELVIVVDYFIRLQ